MGRLTAKRPWHTVIIDIMGLFEQGHRKQFMVSLIDVFSRYVILVPVANHTATSVAKALYCHMIAYFGVLVTILSNRGTEFVGNIWSQLQAMIWCRMNLSSPYHPQGNSVVERSHRTINNLVWVILLEENRLTWCDILAAVQLTMYSAEHAAHTRTHA